MVPSVATLLRWITRPDINKLLDLTASVKLMVMTPESISKSNPARPGLVVSDSTLLTALALVLLIATISNPLVSAIAVEGNDINVFKMLVARLLVLLRSFKSSFASIS